MKSNLLTMFLVLILLGCSTSDEMNSILDKVIKSDIQVEMDQDLHFTDDFIDDTSFDGAVYTKPVRNSTKELDGSAFQAWGRRVTGVASKIFNLSVDGDVAHLLIERSIKGILFIDDTDNSVADPSLKDFRLVTARYATFVKDSMACMSLDCPEPTSRWHLKSISPANVSLALEAGNEQTVFIKTIEVSVDAEKRVNISNPAAKLEVIDEIPTFVTGEIAVVEITVETADPDPYVYIHLPGGRNQAFDDGLGGGDLVAGDGVYTYTYTIGNNVGKHFAGIDLLSNKTLIADNDIYDSAVWGVPYIVENGVSVNNNGDTKVILKNIHKNLFFTKPVNRDITDHGVAFRHGNEGAEVYWGRQVHTSGVDDMSFNITIDGDSAVVDSSVMMVGRFNSTASLVGKKHNTSFTETMIRSAEYKKDDNGKWNLIGISPSTVAKDRFRGVSINSISVKNGIETLFNLTDFTTMQSKDTNLPIVTDGDDILIEVGAENSLADGIYLYLRVGKFYRDRLYDDATHGDLVAGDNVFSRSYSVDMEEGFYMAAVDAVSGKMLKKSNPGEYDSEFVGFFFKVLGK